MPYKNPAQRREYQRKWTADRRASFFQDKVCAVCGSSENLELDHIDRTQKVSHRIWTWSWTRIHAEAAKCQILCEQHHKDKTREEAQPPHGSNNRYTSSVWKCRCAECKAAHAVVNAQYR